MKLTDAVVFTVPVLDVYPGADAVTVTAPILTPVTCGCVVGEVAPAGTTNGPEEICAFDVSLLVTVSVTGASAGDGSVTANVTDWPRDTEVVVGVWSVPALCTVTEAVVSARLGKALAWITAVPSETPVTATVVVVAPCGKLTVAGTVATAVLLELTFTVKPPAGAAPESVKVRFWATNPEMVRVAGVNAIVAVTGTEAVLVV